MDTKKLHGTDEGKIPEKVVTLNTFTPKDDSVTVLSALTMSSN